MVHYESFISSILLTLTDYFVEIMKSITVHNLDEKTAILIEQKAKETGLSLNKTIKLLLRQALGVSYRESSRSHFWSPFQGSRWFKDLVRNYLTEVSQEASVILNLFQNLRSTPRLSGRC